MINQIAYPLEIHQSSSRTSIPEKSLLDVVFEKLTFIEELVQITVKTKAT